MSSGDTQSNLASDCPLCRFKESSHSWLGRTRYNEQVFEYRECRCCRSLFCLPMPNEETVAMMYSADYYDADSVEGLGQDARERFSKQLQWLANRKPGTILDFGCGSGEFLELVKDLGWKIYGIEFDPEVASEVSQRLNAEIVSFADGFQGDLSVDVVHLGDVIEHLTDLDSQLPKIISYIKEDGALVACGPLEANSNLFTSVLKTSRKIRSVPDSEMPPYHVILATALGQRRLFERFDLIEECFELDEISHPAPDKIFANDLLRPQKLVLFGLRKASQLISKFDRDRMGNRFFYVGRRGKDKSREIYRKQ